MTPNYRGQRNERGEFEWFSRGPFRFVLIGESLSGDPCEYVANSSKYSVRLNRMTTISGDFVWIWKIFRNSKDIAAGPFEFKSYEAAADGFVKFKETMCDIF